MKLKPQITGSANENEIFKNYFASQLYLRSICHWHVKKQFRKQSGMSVTSLRGKRRKTAYAGCLYIIKNKSLKGESKT